jgi:hypothetical protein
LTYIKRVGYARSFFAALLATVVAAACINPLEGANMSAISSTQAVRYAKLWLVQHDAFTDGIVQGSVDANGDGSLTNRTDVVVPATIGSIPVWHVSFPSTLDQPGGEPNVFVAQDTDNGTLVDPNPGDDASGNLTDHYVLDHRFTQ